MGKVGFWNHILHLRPFPRPAASESVAVAFFSTGAAIVRFVRNPSSSPDVAAVISIANLR